MKRFLFIALPLFLMIGGGAIYFSPVLREQYARVADLQPTAPSADDLSKKIGERLIEMGYLEDGTIDTSSTASSSSAAASSSTNPTAPARPAPIVSPRSTSKTSTARERVILIGGTGRNGSGQTGSITVIYPDRDFKHEIISFPELISHVISRNLDQDDEHELLAIAARNIYSVDSTNNTWSASAMIPTSEFRLRRLGVGDTNSDGSEELVVSTHKNGQTLLFSRVAARWVPTIISEQAYGPLSTENHDILVKDFDADGRAEILSTPTTAKKMDRSDQWGGTITLFDLVKGQWTSKVLDTFSEGSFVRRILYADANNDGANEIVALIESPMPDTPLGDPSAKRALELVMYTRDRGTYKRSTLIDSPHLTIDHRTVFTTTPYVADVTGSGKNSIVIASPMSLSIFHNGALETIDRFNDISLVATIDDIDRDGINDIVTYSARQKMLLSYSYKNGEWVKRSLVDIELPGIDPFIWSIEVGEI